ncbi:hypothetical protein IP87_21390 [beta proteobacterium AAP121]|nr:hypothetical protein IP80_20040 [beta proteobacterium AAP65]KPF90233.1 hypothetical protein IP87_21390 [beta proteobacterium AAP121]
MPAQFLNIDADTGSFSFPDEAFDGLVAELDGLLDAKEQGALTSAGYTKSLQKLIAEEPDFTDAHAHLAYAWIEQGKPKKALDASLAGLAAANRHIPEGFAGQLPWGLLENRPYLRTLHGALLAAVRLGRHKDAVAFAERMLTLNPTDNQGVRYLLGSELLRAGRVEAAQAAMEPEAANYPPYEYELGLLHLMNRQWVSAATALRRGFLANPYFAEALCGTIDPQPLPIWHSSNLEEPANAHGYVNAYGALWEQRISFLAFLRWLFNSSQVLQERAAVLACREALQWEREFGKRSAWVDRMHALEAAVDDSISTALVVRNVDRQGREVWPWMPEQPLIG